MVTVYLNLQLMLNNLIFNVRLRFMRAPYIRNAVLEYGGRTNIVIIPPWSERVVATGAQITRITS